MELHVILGPPGSGKAGRAVEVLQAAARSGGDVFLCVPGAVDRARFLRELAGRDAGVLLGVEVGTFDQLLDRIAGSPPVRRTDRAMERIVVRDALRASPGFSAAMRWSGFVDTARAHVDELRRARVWGGETLDRAEQQLPGADVATWRALEERVAALLQERRLRDDAWFERRAAAQLQARRPGIGAAVVYGFEDLPPARVELLERLARCVPVTVALPWRPGRRVHERAATLRDRWRDRGAFIEELDEPSGGEPVLAWLGSELFEASSQTAPAPTSGSGAPAPVAFVDCCGPLQEAAEVVREVALLASRGLAWDDIVVASADASRDAELLTAAFDRAGIPARVQARRKAVDVPAGRSLHALLDSIIARDAIRLAASLRSGLFGVGTDRIDAAELRLRGDRHDAGDLFGHRALRRVMPEAVSRLIALPIDSPRVVPAMRELLATLHPADVGELDLLRGVAALLEGLVVAAGGASNLTLADVRDAIGAMPLVTPDRSDAGTVVIASLDDLRSVTFEAVVLRAMHGGAFRARVDDEHAAPAASRDLLHLAVTRARRTLRVVRQAAGADGGHLAPSPAWQELRRLQPQAPLRTRRLGQVLVEPDEVRTRCELEPAAAGAIGRGLLVDDIPPGVEQALRTHRPVARATQLVGPALDAIATRSSVSVTSVERYATCSAKWFIERELRDSDPDDDRSRLVAGQLAHALLQHLVPDALVAKHDEHTLRERAATILPELLADIDPRRTLAAPRVERILEHVLALIEAEREWMPPDRIEVERSFGQGIPESIGPGLVVDGIEITGRVDRIDHHGARVLLHDYKFGSTDRSASKLLADRSLQLLVYWLALEQPAYDLEPIGALYRAITSVGKPSGVLSAELRDIGIIGPRTRAGVLDDEQRRDLLDGAEKLVTDAVRGMREGHVEPLADPARCPDHCRLQTICRVGEVPA